METVEIKRGRGRPRKEVVIDPLTGKPEEKEKKPRGRPAGTKVIKEISTVSISDNLAVVLESTLYAFQEAGKPLDVLKAPLDSGFAYAIGVPVESVVLCDKCTHWYESGNAHNCGEDNGNGTNAAGVDANGSGES